MKKKIVDSFLKICLIFKKKFMLKSFKKDNGIFFLKRIKNIKNIVFDLSSEKYTHIGDSLFYEPIIKQICNNGFNVEVKVQNHLKNYFQAAGHRILTNRDLNYYDLIIAPFWLFNNYNSNLKKKTIFLDPSNYAIDEPVTNYFLKKICLYLNIHISVKSLRPTLMETSTQIFKFDKNKKYIIFNDSIDSGFLGVSQRMKKKLIKKLKSYLKKDVVVLRIGSLSDKKQFPSRLEIDHYDLRGITSVTDMFQLIGNPNVIGTISFDTAIAHISIMYKKKTVIMLRRFSTRHKLHIKKTIMPSYNSSEREKIEYIN